MKHDAYHRLLQQKIYLGDGSPLSVTDLIVQVVDLMSEMPDQI